MYTHLFPGKYFINWQPLLDKFEHYHGLVKSGKITTSDPVSPTSTNAHKLYRKYQVDEDVLLFFDSADSWHTLSGPAIAAEFPPLKRIKDKFAESGIHVGISLNRLTVDGDWHRDLDARACALNIFLHDSDSKTHIRKDDDSILTYSAPRGDVRLIDITKYHRVENRGTRFWVHMRFYEAYDVVKKFLIEGNYFQQDTER